MVDLSHFSLCQDKGAMGITFQPFWGVLGYPFLSLGYLEGMECIFCGVENIVSIRI